MIVTHAALIAEIAGLTAEVRHLRAVDIASRKELDRQAACIADLEGERDEAALLAAVVADALTRRVRKLEAMVAGLSERVAQQSDLLSRRAEVQPVPN